MKIKYGKNIITTSPMPVKFIGKAECINNTALIKIISSLYTG